ncbi:Protein transport protein Y [Penicillium diatomitis]|uniref:Protein transport protein Y n=1 Tax=Penicillium diatomitis TaxID=2819901 RepID=A0A9X0BSN7_9EURO|nr:Protein transport protein Y [Penicillium diatomitis]KAJ5482798.1 Protein transport protein Y [Penicillium diatomitis]
MLLFGLGNLVYVIVLIINAIAVLSEDRFLARSSSPPSPPAFGWGRTQAEPGFGASYDSTSVKAKSVNLIASVRTVMRIPLIVINTVIIVYELILG